MTKVYIINKSSHNFSATKKFGKAIYLSKGLMNRYATTNIHRHFCKLFKKSKPEDYIVLCSLNVILFCLLQCMMKQVLITFQMFLAQIMLKQSRI